MDKEIETWKRQATSQPFHKWWSQNLNPERLASELQNYTLLKKLSAEHITD